MGKYVRKYRSQVEALQKSEPEKTVKRVRKKNPTAKLSKSDPDYYSKIGQISAAKRIRKFGTSYLSELAKKSHPREVYRGGRPKKVKPENE